jgi:NADH-quinone oxidoreductase subunit J
MVLEYIVFFVTAAIAVVGALGMLLSRSAVHSALFLLLSFFAVAVLFLLLQSFFLALIYVMVYAGAIMVLFLFVVMLLGAERVEDRPDRLSWQRWLAVGLGAVLFVQAIIVGAMATVSGTVAQDGAQVALINAPENIGIALFTTYLLPFEITGVLLLVGIIGVVVLQQRSRLEQAEAAALQAEAGNAASSPPAAEAAEATEPAELIEAAEPAGTNRATEA